MAYDEPLADRMRAALSNRTDVVEKKMFGGLAFMIAGTMACGIIGKDMMAKVGEARLHAALKRPHTRVMDFTGKPSRHMVYVEPAGTKTVSAIKKWTDEVAKLAESTPKKKTTPKRAVRR